MVDKIHTCTHISMFYPTYEEQSQHVDVINKINAKKERNEFHLDEKICLLTELGFDDV